MKTEIFERILINLLQYYLSLDESEIEKRLIEPALGTKERVTTIDDLQIIIYSNDHTPPHFHVKTNDLRIDAKFKIENCELLSGSIGSKDLKKIRAFYLSPKGKIVLESIWQKVQRDIRIG
jgi:hypothetical protein